MSDFEHITYCVDESANDTIIDVESFLTDFEKSNNFSNDGLMFVEMKDYDLNYSVKQLLLICEYYNISKNKTLLNKLYCLNTIRTILMQFKNENKCGSILMN